MFSPSPVHTMLFQQRTIYIKRDDLLDEAFSGNKARKFDYFFYHQFPEVTHVIGSGSAQANSLYSLSELAKRKGWQLDFFVDHIPSYVKQNPRGNYLAALNNGARVISVSDHVQYAHIKADNLDDKVAVIAADYQSRLGQEQVLHVPEGGRCEYAQSGVAKLGAEIVSWANDNSIQQLDIFLPAGTGTTALYLQQYFVQQHIADNFKVFTCATVGSADYLKQQFMQLTDNSSELPTILSNGKKYHFGKLYRECYDIWREVNEGGIEFELLYDPIGFLVLKHYLSHCQIEQGKSSIGNRPIMYIHQGGLKGNETMLPRYQRKYPD
ncbi:1-aminocyclopropane-1-carboxylate deaminase/D-cysteine desulfhydrase [Shewanella sp. WXL01]|uniref:1-aminocyclopropane-1-carboxylate deaminase/D-cysteine desulfhydrase n=1 Tax=Shewanella sp. WXL01 TaxID=2709721 RepID=UPI0014384F0E|nr:1-aminocyclopropane-1-carboxylate deaminase/D-cysteine desulfhydrase [Shewanella sp. WXL01]NKF51612.1 1-aminocyclopropane-1-carboxylate deaminase/D-cysteine desulfhydrase [Shewanella sp. WXL01]